MRILSSRQYPTLTSIGMDSPDSSRDWPNLVDSFMSRLRMAVAVSRVRVDKQRVLTKGLMER
jgi:hypothetical protein